MGRLLPGLNWQSHLFVLSNEGAVTCEAAEGIARAAADFLRRCGFASIILHPVLKMPNATADPWNEWGRLLSTCTAFQEEAYEEQSGARFLIAPILMCNRDTDPEETARVAAFFNSHFATPSFYLRDGAAREFDGDVRQYLDPEGTTDGSIVGQLWMSHVFESVLQHVDEQAGELIQPCRRHWVLDEAGGDLFACFKQWKLGEAAASLEEREPPACHGTVAEQHCPECLAHSMVPMKRNLLANGRRKEGREACFGLARSLSKRARHGLAADLAHCAFELAENDEERTAALIHEGLCRLDLGELQKAEDTLESASQFSTDPGLVAYHRGRVQFVWRDYIEALERFEEALESDSSQFPRRDTCFQMALCHINLEEYAEARPYLERSLKVAEESAPVSFYRGICDLGEGEAEAALVHFRESLRIGPAAEDLGRVLFYVGNCLKDLGRFEEAIDMLKRAVQADPQDLPNHNLLGFCYYKIKQHEEAVCCFQHAVEIDPGSAIDWANLGSNLRDLGRSAEAISMYEKALALDPSIGFARASLTKLRKLARGNNG